MTEDLLWFGRYNDMPPNYERITEAEFWRTFGGSQGCRGSITKYVTNVKAGHPLYGKHLTMFTYDGQVAVGYVQRIEAALPAKPKVFFKSCACHHDFKVVQIGKMLRRYTCTKCPYTYDLDSSG